MMEFYTVTEVVYNNDKVVGVECGKTLRDTEPDNEEIFITWNNLDEVYNNYGLGFKLNVWDKRKGRVVGFFTRGRKLKEWKDELNLRYTITYNKYTPTIEEVLKWGELEKAIAYLKEKGLKVER